MPRPPGGGIQNTCSILKSQVTLGFVALHLSSKRVLHWTVTRVTLGFLALHWSSKHVFYTEHSQVTLGFVALHWSSKHVFYTERSQGLHWDFLLFTGAQKQKHQGTAIIIMCIILYYSCLGKNTNFFLMTVGFFLHLVKTYEQKRTWHGCLWPLTRLRTS